MSGITKEKLVSTIFPDKLHDLMEINEKHRRNTKHKTTQIFDVNLGSYTIWMVCVTIKGGNTSITQYPSEKEALESIE